MESGVMTFVAQYTFSVPDLLFNDDIHFQISAGSRGSRAKRHMSLALAPGWGAKSAPGVFQSALCNSMRVFHLTKNKILPLTWK